ncbi:MAG TPA: histidine kinase [Longimicrobiales bacterium]|nr:histidine kinase [Longimicrobiales bacterium]
MSHVIPSGDSEQDSHRPPDRERQEHADLLRALGRLALHADDVSYSSDSRASRELETDPEAASGFHSLRERVAGELHDGVLQVLTAIAVHLDAADMMMESRPDDARALINEVCKAVRAEQREIRMFVDELKGPDAASHAGRIPMEERVRAMLDRVQKMWGVSCRLTCHGELPGGTAEGRTVLRLVQEATMNAIRHGNATRIEVRIRRAGDKIRLIVSDDGSGFDPDGGLDHDVLVASRLGPVLLKRRVIGARGRLRILTSDGGTHIFICVPDGEADGPGDAESIH